MKTMNKIELMHQRRIENKLRFGDFATGGGVIYNKAPTNEDEVIQHGNALAASGNYPVGTSACFNIGIAGGCGQDCFVFKDGDCDVEQEIKDNG